MHSSREPAPDAQNVRQNGGVADEAQRQADPASVYNEDYFRTGCGLPYERSDHWLGFFSGIADQIIRSLRPRRVLDAGCAMGFLVEAFWDRGVEAWGIDASPYAISKVRRDIQPYCRVASLCETIEGSYDLITCIEVLEHMPDGEALVAAKNLAGVADRILFSSSPFDLTEPTHINVHPLIYWLKLFAGLGFSPDLLYDASFIAAHAMLLRRTGESLSDDVLALFAETLRKKSALVEKDFRIHALQQEMSALTAQLEAQRGENDLVEIRARVNQIEDHLREAAQTAQAVEQRLHGELTKQLANLHKEAAAQEAKLVAETSEVRRGSQSLSEQLEVLRRISSAQKTDLVALQTQVTALEGSQRASAERLEAIYRSRTWRTLTRVGRLWLAIPYSWRLPQRIVRQTANRVRALLSRVKDDHVIVAADYPPCERETILRGEAEIRGWASAKTGVRKLEIFLDNRPVAAQYGLSRSDVGQHFPTYRDSGRSGFRALLDTRQLVPGAYRLRVVATARSGRIAETTCPVRIDLRSDYEIWWERNRPTDSAVRQMKAEAKLFSYRPKINIVTPVFRTPREALKRCVESVKAQVYREWELILVDDGSQDPDLCALMLDLAAADDRIRTEFLAGNRGIAAATNSGLRLAGGEFVGFLDHDDELAPNALYEVVRELNEDPEWEVFYSDEDKITPEGVHQDGFFKPDWSPDLLLSVNYLCHFHGLPPRAVRATRWTPRGI